MQALLFADLTNRRLTTTLGGSPVSFPPFVQGDSVRLGLRFSENVEGGAEEVTKVVTSLRASIGFVDERPTGGSFVLGIPSLTQMSVTGTLTSNGSTPVVFPSLAFQSSSFGGVSRYGAGVIGDTTQYQLYRDAFSNVWKLAYVESAGVVREWSGNGSGQASPVLVTTWTAQGSATGTPVVTTGTALTAPIAHDATAAAVQSALVAIGLTGCSVVKNAGSWILSNAGAAINLSGASATGLAAELTPSSFVRIRSTTSGGQNHYEVRLIQAPLASTSSFELIVPPAPSVSRIQEGDSDATVVWPEIQALKILPTFRGTYQIRRGFKKTSELSIDDGPEEIAAALAALADEDGSFTVTNPATNIAHITFLGSMSGIPQELLEIVVFSAPAGDPTLVLDLNTAEVAAALRAVDEIKPSLELEMSVVDENDPELIHVLTPYRAPITLVRDMNWEGLETAASIDWLRPPHGTSYIPFTADQIITGSQNYVTPVGNGTATAITLTHNLGTRDLHVTVRKNSGDLAQVTPASIKFDTINTLTLTFATAPTSNQYVAVVSTAGPESVFQAHTHTTGQIEGLNLILDELGTRLETLESIVAMPGATGSNLPGQDLEIVLPAVSLVVPPTKDANAKPPLLGAVHDATATVVTPPLATVLADAGQVKQINTDWTIPASRNRRDWPVKDDGYIASNGEIYYEVRKAGNSYFPVEMEHDLFMLWISGTMFPSKRFFNLEAKPVLQLLGNTRAQYVLEVAFGTLTEDTGTGFAMNLAGVNWAAPIISERLLLSSAIVPHPINVQVTSNTSGVLSATAAIYGRTQTVTAPTSNAFALRARLLNFDTENRTAPRGLVAVKMEESKATISAL